MPKATARPTPTAVCVDGGGRVSGSVVGRAAAVVGEPTRTRVGAVWFAAAVDAATSAAPASTSDLDADSGVELVAGGFQVVTTRALSSVVAIGRGVGKFEDFQTMQAAKITVTVVLLVQQRQ